MKPYSMFGCEQPIIQICLEPATYSNAVRVFGIPEYLSASAILLLVLSVSDYRYRLRLQLSGLGGQSALFLIAGVIGIMLMLVEFWFLKGLPVPAAFNDLAVIQLALGGAFLLIVLYCCFSVFVRPPTLNSASAQRWATAIYRLVGDGDEKKLAILGSEIEQSISPMFDLAGRCTSDSSSLSPNFAAYRCVDLLADPRVVRALVRSAPWTIVRIFTKLGECDPRRLPVEFLVANIGSELITAENSPLRWERDGVDGYFRALQPLGNAVFGDSSLVDSLSNGFGPLDALGHHSWEMDREQIQNYAEALLIYSRDLINKNRSRSTVFNRALHNVVRSGMKIRHLNGVEDLSNYELAQQGFHTSVRVISDLVDVMEQEGYRYYGDWRSDNETILARLVDAILTLILYATSVRGPPETAWSVHHNTLWSEFWDFRDGPMHDLVRKMVRRRIYLKIREMDRYANFVSARYLGYVLNILGVSARRERRRNSDPLKMVAVGYAKRNFLTLRRDYPPVAEAVLLGAISFDEVTGELVKIFTSGVQGTAPTERLHLDPPNHSMEENS